MQVVKPRADDELAQRLGMTYEDFAETFGTGWRMSPTTVVDFDADPSGAGEIFGDWYVAGEPPQLMLRPRDDAVDLGVPHGVWAGGAMGLEYQARDRTTVRLDVEGVEEARSEVDRIVRQLRRSFAWCRYCHTLTPPELTHERGFCMGCAAAIQGIVP